MTCARCGVEPRTADYLIGSWCLGSADTFRERYEAEERFTDYREQRAFLRAEYGWYGWRTASPERRQGLPLSDGAPRRRTFPEYPSP